MSDTATVHIDGAARGNPGPAAFAYVLQRPGEPVVEHAETMGTATNNVAEYTALVSALERAAELGVKELAVFSDSELLVKQMNGEYRVKHPDLQALHREASDLRKRFARVTLAHVRRAQNADADRLCNEALDGKRKAAELAPAMTPEPVQRTRAGVPERLEEEAVALLNAVAKSWAGSGGAHPPAVEVWDKLWALLGEHGVLKKPKG
ncbi:MAG: ribonuclease HI family protein [Gemmataceae bacterium]